MTETLENLETAVSGFLAREPSPSPERIRELIEQFRQIDSCRVDDQIAEQLARRFEVRHGVEMTVGTILTGDAPHEPWLEAARAAGMDTYYWERYKFLLAEKQMSGQVIATLDEVTDRVLGSLGDPAKEGPWDRRGLVVGHVQSGKTANYTGLICKAADAGYKLVVVIAGIHNNLRNQTQLRIDEGFVGRDSARLLSQKQNMLIGVGRIDQSRRPVTFTNSVRDFNKAMATGVGMPLQNLNEPAVFVIKKNSSTLKNLLEWLVEHSTKGGHKKVDVPMLLIDDEADNASINVKHGKSEVSRINGQIRDLLGKFDRSCYIGYTATPFANIFIDPDSDDEMLGEDLFPQDFIISLDPPTNYFGPSRVFLDGPNSPVRYIEDSEDYLPAKHVITTIVQALPPSMVCALQAFIVARAIRIARGQDLEHSSMLVNASRFTDVQRQIRNELHARLDAIQASARVHSGLTSGEALKDPEIRSLHDVWEQEYAGALPWADVQGWLIPAVAPMKVVEVNSRASGILNYADHEKTGLSVIAVGGFSLSRGLTLEGLTVSYFLRNSLMYDTLMQMGRWFGYRPGYDDLCRIWMPEEAEGHYTHIAESIEMLRSELRTMEAAGATPRDFGLKVRSHPDALMVTARNKMGSGQKVVVKIGLAKSFPETSILDRRDAALDANRAAIGRFCEGLSAAGAPVSRARPVPGGWLLTAAPVRPVVDFLRAFKNHPASILTDPDPVSAYIEDRMGDELANWDILFASTQGREEGNVVDESLGLRINCQRRSAGVKSDQRILRISNKQRVSSRGVEKTGLTDDEIRKAESEYEGDTTNYPDWIYRSVRKRPLLIIHLLKVEPEAGGKAPEVPVVAWSISFPATELEEETVEYVVNTTWLRENFADEFDDERAGDDE